MPPLFGPLPGPPVVVPDQPTPGTAQMVDLLVRAFATDYNDSARDNRQPVPAQMFPAPAYRFDTDDGSVTFSGDTGPHPDLVELATGTDVLVHEVIDLSAVAEQAGAGTLALHHLLPASWPEHLRLEAQQGCSGRLVVGRDLDRIGVGRRERIAHTTGGGPSGRRG